MRKMSKRLSVLAALTALSAAVPAHAALQGFSPNGTFDGAPALLADGAMPTWFQDPNGIAVGPCIGIGPGAAANCGIGAFIGTGTYIGGPYVWPTNFPDEIFYFDVVVGPTVLQGNPTVTADCFAALEMVTFDPLSGALVPPGPGVAIGGFHRLQCTVAPIADVDRVGTWTVTHPWGTTSFNAATDCTNSQGGCRFRAEIPGGQTLNTWTPVLGLAEPVPPNLFTIHSFLRSDAAPAGFLGDGATPATFTGGTAGNVWEVSGPLGTTGPITLATITGQTVGLELAPQGAIDFGKVKPAGPVVRTINVNNLAGVAFTPVITATVPGSNPPTASPDFTVAPTPGLTGCPTGLNTLAAGATCDFDVTFAPVGADGPRSATISVSGPAVPPVTTTVTGTTDATLPVITLDGIARFTKLATQTLTGTLSEAGTVEVSVDGAAPVAATVTGTTWTFNVPALALDAPHTIQVTANDTALPAPGNPAAPVNDSITVDTIVPAVAVTEPAPAALTKASTPLTFSATDTNALTTVVKVDGVIVTPAPTTLGPLADGPHTVAVESTDPAGNVTTVSNTFTSDGTPPVVAIASPVRTVASPTPNTIGVTNPVLTFTETDANKNPATPPVVRLDGVVIPVVSGTTTLGPFTPGQAHTLEIEATDAVGNVTIQTMPISLLLADGAMTTLGTQRPVIGDVLKALRIVAQLETLDPASDSFKHGDVAPMTNNVPQPDGEITIGDVVLILRKVAELINF